MHSNRMKAAFVTSLAILLGFGLSAIYQTFAWERSAASVSQSWETISALDEVILKSYAVEESSRRLATAFDPGVADQIRSDVETIRHLARQADAAARRDASSSVRWQDLDRILDRQGALLGAPAAALSRENWLAARQAWDNGLGTARLLAVADVLRREEADQIQQRIRRQVAMLDRTRQLFGVAGGISLLLILMTAVRVSRDSHRAGESEKTLAAREEQYRQVVESAGDIIYRADEKGRFTFINQAALSMLHFTEREVISRSYLKLVRHDHRNEVARFYMRQFARRRKNTYMEFPVIDGHGRTRWLGQNVQLVVDNGKITGYQAIARDITQRRRAEGELEKSRAFIERIALTTPGLLYVFDLVAKRNVFSNREVAALLGYKVEEFQNRADILELVHPDDRHAVNGHYESLRNAVDGEVRHIEYRMRHTDGRWIWLLGRDTPFERDPNGNVHQIVGIAQDVTERRAAQEKLAWQANFDALTGLPNRHHFWIRFQSALRQASLEQTSASICLFDIDHFKEINDRFGHSGGDEVLEAVGAIVKSELRSSDVAGRLGGDEFCLVLPDTDADEAARVSERIRDRLITQAFGVNGGSLFSVTATFGVAEWHPQMEAREVMESADRALYRAKSSGRNRVCVDA